MLSSLGLLIGGSLCLLATIALSDNKNTKNKNIDNGNVNEVIRIIKNSNYDDAHYYWYYILTADDRCYVIENATEEQLGVLRIKDFI